MLFQNHRHRPGPCTQVAAQKAQSAAAGRWLRGEGTTTSEDKTGRPQVSVLPRTLAARLGAEDREGMNI